jgi:NAD(P)-dependent dehydrogenase (short-subunit alcohol dehydrogenase family)
VDGIEVRRAKFGFLGRTWMRLSEYFAVHFAPAIVVDNPAVEWAKYDITVNAVSPTVIMTELGKKAWAGDVGEAMKRKIPAGRFGHPDEVAAAVLYLCSDAAALVTGTNLIIDGGYTIQ